MWTVILYFLIDYSSKIEWLILQCQSIVSDRKPHSGGRKRLCPKADFWSFAIPQPSKGCPLVNPWSLLLVVVVLGWSPSITSVMVMVSATCYIWLVYCHPPNNSPPWWRRCINIFISEVSFSIWQGSFNYSLWFYQEGENQIDWAKIQRFKIYFNPVMKCYGIFGPSKLHWETEWVQSNKKYQEGKKCKSSQCKMSK